MVWSGEVGGEALFPDPQAARTPSPSAFGGLLRPDGDVASLPRRARVLFLALARNIFSRCLRFAISMLRRLTRDACIVVTQGLKGLQPYGGYSISFLFYFFFFENGR
jgi:hypothetical protein